MTIKEKLLNSGNVEKRHVVLYELYDIGLKRKSPCCSCINENFLYKKVVLKEENCYIFLNMSWEKFRNANDKNKIIHDLNLRRWALEAKKEINFLYFKAGAIWILNFKRKHGMMSRKITKFINRSSMTNQEPLQIVCQKFISSVKSL